MKAHQNEKGRRNKLLQEMETASTIQIIICPRHKITLSMLQKNSSPQTVNIDHTYYHPRMTVYTCMFLSSRRVQHSTS